MEENGYTAVQIPKELIKQVDDIIGRKIDGFRTRPEVINTALRQFLEKFRDGGC